VTVWQPPELDGDVGGGAGTLVPGIALVVGTELDVAGTGPVVVVEPTGFAGIVVVVEGEHFAGADSDPEHEIEAAVDLFRKPK
jgi:hypothetical protein